MFSYLSPETRVRKDHPLRAIRSMVYEVFAQLSRRFDTMCASAGRPSIPPEELLLQMLYSIRNERLLMEEIDYMKLALLLGTTEGPSLISLAASHPHTVGVFAAHVVS